MPEDGSRQMSLYTATCLVIANMVGTGVFTSVGFQIGAGLSPFTILLLWLVGGICAFCGGVAYSELAASLPRSGGEYHVLSRIYHPAIGFLAGWASVTAGFAAPVALAAIAFGKYVNRLWPVIGVGYAAGTAVAVITIIMVGSERVRTWFQDTATSLKVILLSVLIIAGWIIPAQGSSLAPKSGDLAQLITPQFAVSLAWVMYAYAGWNASVYVTGQVRNPSKVVPLSMAIGTIAVTVLYVLVNGAFLRLAPAEALSNEVEAGLIAAQHGFGNTGGRLVGLLISLGLLSHLGAMQWVGPHVLSTMGEDHRALRPFARVNRQGLPIVATLTQTAIVALMLLTSTFESVLNYVLFTITLCSFLTVLGVFVMRYHEPDLPRPVKAWGYPFTPLIYLAIMGWMLAHVLKRHPGESAWGFATLLAGLIVFHFSERRLK
jgi:basic amino acid/polyamine antiporter, APA family